MGDYDGNSYFDAYTTCYGHGYGYPCGGIEVGHGHNGYYGDYGYDSSSSCGDGFYFYNYDNSDDSDDYCGGYGYLNRNSYVDSDYCDRNYYNYGHGLYVDSDCGHDYDGDSYFDVYSTCYGHGYGYPCGGIEVGHGHNGYYGNYGYDSSSSCGDGLYFYDYDYCGDSDDYCGGYGYLNCNSYVDSDYCYGDYYNYGHGTYLNHYCDG